MNPSVDSPPPRSGAASTARATSSRGIPSGSSDTSATGIPTAPRGRRSDHALLAVVGLILAPTLLAWMGWALTVAQQGHRLSGFLIAAVLCALILAVQALAAVRSSVSGLIAGLVIVVLQYALLAWPPLAALVPTSWLTGVEETGLAALTAGLLMGGSWAMRVARRAGRQQARVSARLAKSDRHPGVTPPAPPSRRQAHLASLAITVPTVLVAIIVARGHHLTPVAERNLAHVSVPGLVALVVAMVLILAAAASTGYSTLGARFTGFVVAALGIAGVFSPQWPTIVGVLVPCQFLRSAAGSLTLMICGLLLMVVGWAVHGARRRGRSQEALTLT